jgi:hypothetical protein
MVIYCFILYAIYCKVYIKIRKYYIFVTNIILFQIKQTKHNYYLILIIIIDEKEK